MAVRPKTRTHLASVLGAINMKAISCQGFSASPQAPAYQRATSCAGMIACTWNCITTGQKLSEPHLAFVDASYKQMSVESSQELAHGSLQWKKKDQLASKRQYPNAWGRHWL